MLDLHHEDYEQQVVAWASNSIVVGGDTLTLKQKIGCDSFDFATLFATSLLLSRLFKESY